MPKTWATTIFMTVLDGLNGGKKKANHLKLCLFGSMYMKLASYHHRLS